MDELLEKIARIVPTLEGWCSVAKAQWMARKVVEMGASVIVELGVFGGSSLVPLGLASQYLETSQLRADSAVYGFDPYTHEAALEGDLRDADVQWWTEIDLGRIKEIAIAALTRNELNDTVALDFCTSVQAVEAFGDGEICLLHIDACHSEIASTRDVKMWLPKVRAGGVIVLDDVDWLTVAAARSMLHDRCKLIHAHPQWEAFEV